MSTPNIKIGQRWYSIAFQRCGLVDIRGISGERVTFGRGRDEWCYSREDFLKEYALAPYDADLLTQRVLSDRLPKIWS